MRSRTLALALSLCLSVPAILAAQQPGQAAGSAPQDLGLVTGAPAPAMPDGAVVPDSFLVTFQRRSFTLDEYRDAIHARRPAAEVEAIVARLEQAVRADQAPFVQEVERLGGRVTDQWWVVNGCCVSLAAGKRDRLARLPNVDSVTENRWYRAVLNDASNATHHDSDAANLKDARGGGKVIGTGIGVAVLDTGCDGMMGASGRPHRAYYPGGNLANPHLLKQQLGTSGFGSEDAHSHGTFVQGCVGANKWSPDTRVDNGMAPGAGIVSIKISDNSGSAAGNWLISGWQLVASRRATDNLAVANNSFSGSPSLGDPIQVALDTVAFSSDVLITCASGNNGTNLANSQSVYNGLAVGSIEKYSLAVSSFSGRGTLYGSRTYPDIVACGSGVNSTLRDSESTIASMTGTSFSSPMVAGAAALVRHADTRITALQCKAILLNQTQVPASAQRTQYGLGILKCDRAVDAALAGDYQTVRLTNPVKVANLPFIAQANVARSITCTWMRNGSAVPYNVDLRIFDANNTLVAADLNADNSYEKVTFTPAATGTYRAEVTWTSVVFGNVSLDIGVSGVGAACSSTPSLTSATPSTISNYQPPQVVVDGMNLNGAFQATVGGSNVQVTVLSPTQVRFSPPFPLPIGNVNVTVTTPCGTSNPIPLTVQGKHPAQLDGRVIVVRSDTQPYDYKLYTDANWVGLLFVSMSNQPSILPGIASFGIGNNFADLVFVTPMTADNRGFSQLNLVFPTTLPSVGVYFQAGCLSATAPVLPAEMTNVQPTTIL
jgi:hypothetical protein